VGGARGCVARARAAHAPDDACGAVTRARARCARRFFLGATEWGAGQLEDELRAGAWLALECDPSLVIKDRVVGWRPGKPKPVWTELMNVLDTKEAKRLVGQVYRVSSEE
jgi:putative AlgH/UPF0301 family transcriptional regulator